MRYGYLIFIYGVCITYLKIRTHMISPEFRDCCWSEYPKFKLYDCWPNKDTVISMDRNCNQYCLKVWKCPLTAQKNGICLPFAACAESRWSLCHHSSIGQWPVLSPNQDRPMSGRWKNRTKWQPKRVFFFCIYVPSEHSWVDLGLKSEVAKTKRGCDRQPITFSLLVGHQSSEIPMQQSCDPHTTKQTHCVLQLPLAALQWQQCGSTLDPNTLNRFWWLQNASIARS